MGVEFNEVETETTTNLGSFCSRGRAMIMGIDQSVLEQRYREVKNSGSSFSYECELGARLHSIVHHKSSWYLYVSYDPETGYSLSLDGDSVFNSRSWRFDHRHYEFLEYELKDIFPVQELIHQIKDVFVQYYRECIVYDNLTTRSLSEILDQQIGSLPRIATEFECRCMGDFLFGIAWKMAREQVLTEIETLPEGTYWERNSRLLETFNVECAFVSAAMFKSIGEQKLFASWYWSWAFWDETFSGGYLHVEEERTRRGRAKVRKKLEHQLQFVMQRINKRVIRAFPMVLGGIPAIGKTTTIRASARTDQTVPSTSSEQMVVIADLDAKTTEHEEAKRNLTERIAAYEVDQAFPQPYGVKLENGKLIITHNLERDIPSDEYDNFLRFFEVWQLYMRYTATAAERAKVDFVHLCQTYPLEELHGLYVHSYFQTMAEVPLVFSFVLFWESVLEDYINRNHPGLFEALEYDSEVKIPDDIRLIVETLILDREATSINSFICAAIGTCWILDAPACLVRERIAREKASGIDTRRGIYTRYLGLMRLMNICVAKMFPNYFRVLPVVSKDAGSLKPLSPGQIVWKQRMFEAFISLAGSFHGVYQDMYAGPLFAVEISRFPEISGMFPGDEKVARKIIQVVREKLTGLREELMRISDDLAGLSPEDYTHDTSYIEMTKLAEINLWRLVKK